ncbi:hypothetical protein ISCGN_023270 [Ixodes scapularis]
MDRSRRKYVIWQWNCRGFRRKRGNLQQYVSTKEEESTPDVIAFQKTWGMAKLCGYRAYGKDAKEKTRVTTLVRRNLPVIEHDTGISTVEHVLIEIISNTKRDGRSVFVLNVYSSPAKRHRFAALFRATLEIAKQQTLAVVGDFNAPHPDWGYLTETVKGRNLWHVAHDGGLTLITDPDQPTRRGDARHRDTTPDLAFVRNDVMLRLKHQIVDGTGSSPLDTKAILGLDLTKAFDNIIHDAVLDNLRALAVGKRTYEYIQNFLSGRKARLAVGGVESEDICLGGKGTPQGSHSIYADDITLWVTGGSDGYIEEVLQEAIRVVEEYVAPRGLACSPQKPELLLLRPKRGGKEKSNIELFAQGHRIPQVKSIRVLGLRIQADGKNREMIQALKGTAYQVARLIARISNRNYGMKESNLMRLVQAFVMSRLAYVVPFYAPPRDIDPSKRCSASKKSKMGLIVYLFVCISRPIGC